MSSYFEPDAAALSGTTSIPIVVPDIAADASVLIASGANAYGAWVTVAAANVLAAHMLIGYATDPAITVAPSRYYLEFGIGGVDSEVGIGKSVMHISGQTNGFATLYFPQGLMIPANARVAARAAAPAARNFYLWCIFMPRPLA